MPNLDDLVGMLNAASETTRLRMLALMSQGELSVKDMTDILGQSQPRVSRHLRLLADAGLAVRHAEGAWAYYRLAESKDGGDLVRRLITTLDIEDPVLRADRERLGQVRQAHEAHATAYFATVADDWDALRGLHVAESAVEAAIVEVVAKRRFERVVDLGTGTGRMLELLAPYYAFGTGIDSSREMINVARSKLSAAGAHHAQVRMADIAEAPEGNGDADLAILHQVLHYFDDPGRILLSAARFLRPGGEILVVDFATHGFEFLREKHAHRRLGLSEAQMEAWAQAAGLEVRITRSFPNPEVKDGLTVCLWWLAKRNGDER